MLRCTLNALLLCFIAYVMARKPLAKWTRDAEPAKTASQFTVFISKNKAADTAESRGVGE